MIHWRHQMCSFVKQSYPALKASDAMENMGVSGISVRFPDDATVHIEWNPSTDTDRQISYKVIESANQADILDRVVQPGHIVNDLAWCYLHPSH
jgi:hypothetical protein